MNEFMIKQAVKAFGGVGPILDHLKGFKPKIIEHVANKISEDVRDEEGKLQEGEEREACLLVPGHDEKGNPTLFAFMQSVDKDRRKVRDCGYYDLGKEVDAFDLSQFMSDDQGKALPPSSEEGGT